MKKTLIFCIISLFFSYNASANISEWLLAKLNDIRKSHPSLYELNGEPSDCDKPVKTWALENGNAILMVKPYTNTYCFHYQSENGYNPLGLISYFVDERSNTATIDYFQHAPFLNMIAAKNNGQMNRIENESFAEIISHIPESCKQVKVQLPWTLYSDERAHQLARQGFENVGYNTWEKKLK